MVQCTLFVIMAEDNPIKKLYFAIEDQYYGVMDFFDKKLGLPVYKFFVDPIENNGVPSFPFALLFLALIAGGVFLALSPSMALISLRLPLGDLLMV